MLDKGAATKEGDLCAQRMRDTHECHVCRLVLVPQQHILHVLAHASSQLCARQPPRCTHTRCPLTTVLSVCFCRRAVAARWQARRRRGGKRGGGSLASEAAHDARCAPSGHCSACRKSMIMRRCFCFCLSDSSIFFHFLFEKTHILLMLGVNHLSAVTLTSIKDRGKPPTFLEQGKRILTRRPL